MKRYNIHLDPEWIKELDKICKELQNEARHNYDYWGMTRSSLIRFAIGQTFNLKEEYTAFNTEYLEKHIKEAIKKRAKQKGV